MGKNWAIVVGINNYDNLQSLKYAQRDAEAMQAWFSDEANFHRVFLFTKDSPAIPANPPIPTQPTQGRFKRFLNAQFEEPLLKPEDNLWFFFAGHGKRFKDQDYLMFLDSDPTDYTTAISVDYVTQRLRRCGADNVVLLIDACRDEGDRSGLGVGMQEHKGVITFYSCAANQKSWEIDELQHGSFTYTLLEGLRVQGEANCATVERLEQHLRYEVPQLNARYKKSPQNPSLKAEPPYKMYYILLEQAARIKDVEPLKYQASLAENRGDLLLAKQLWVRVLAVSRGDWEAVEAIERIAYNRGNFEPTITTEVIIAANGGRSTKELPLADKQAEQQARIKQQQEAELRGLNDKSASIWLNKQSLQLLFLVSVIVTSLISGMRTLGLMQSWELMAFDLMMQMRPDEGMDQRLLAIMVTEADIQTQKQKQKSSLSDITLEQLLQKLRPNRPKAIGLDFYRDFSVDSQHPKLVTDLQDNDKLIAICKVSGATQKMAGVAPPPQVPSERVGFSDVIPDSDYFIRRQLLFMNPSAESPCQTNYSFSFQLAP